MLGLRPRLKPRPSLLDLIARHNLDGHISPSQPHHPLEPDDDLAFDIPLPVSPEQTRSTAKPRASSEPAATSAAPSIRIMAPSRKDQEAGEDQYGAVFSVSGPVIVAENMIGCAMYELVGPYACCITYT
jgi:V-type H+-transporting ATPase subunit A